MAREHPSAPPTKIKKNAASLSGLARARSCAADSYDLHSSSPHAVHTRATPRRREERLHVQLCESAVPDARHGPGPSRRRRRRRRYLPFAGYPLSLPLMGYSQEAFFLSRDGTDGIVFVALLLAGRKFSAQVHVMRSGAWGDGIFATTDFPAASIRIVDIMMPVHGKLYMVTDMGYIHGLDFVTQFFAVKWLEHALKFVCLSFFFKVVLKYLEDKKNDNEELLWFP